jgi:hypothetical protein
MVVLATSFFSIRLPAQEYRGLVPKGPLCSPQMGGGVGMVGGTPFYQKFLVKSSSLKDPIVSVYQSVDKALAENCRNFPKSGSAEAVMKFVNAQRDFCVNKCDEVIKANNYSNRQFNRMRQDCQTICREDSNDQSIAALGYAIGFGDGKASCGSSQATTKASGSR